MRMKTFFVPLIEIKICTSRMGHRKQFTNLQWLIWIWKSPLRTVHDCLVRAAGPLLVLVRYPASGVWPGAATVSQIDIFVRFKQNAGRWR